MPNIASIIFSITTIFKNIFIGLMRRLKKATLLCITLFIASISLLYWQDVGMNISAIVTKNTLIEGFSDGNIVSSPEASNAKLSMSDTEKKLSCQIRIYYDFPFCEFKITLVKNYQQAINFSHFDTVSVVLAYQGPASQTDLNFRLQMHNFEPRFDYSNQINAFRINEAKVSVDNVSDLSQFKSNQIPLTDFYVPAWWSSMMKLSKAESIVKIDSVTYIKLVTPEDLKRGNHVITLKEIKFEGKYISQKFLLIILASIWIIVFIVYIVCKYIKIYKRTEKLKAQQKDLQIVNKILEIETEELKELVTRDHLTGIRNRHGIRDLLIELISKTENKGFNLSAMYLDLDKFKLINDQYGHDMGDKVLVQFTQLISENIRSNDIFARWGGEEFILISPEFGYTKARLLAEKLRKIIEKETWPENINVTCSIGLTEYKLGEDLADFLKRADTALYESKAKGRNRTTVL